MKPMTMEMMVVMAMHITLCSMMRICGSRLLRQLKCIVCGRVDEKSKTLGIPVQCFAGDEKVHEMLKRYHTNVYPPCTVAMHVGCARWKLDCAESICANRLFYFPALLSDDNNSYEEEERKSKHPMLNGKKNHQPTNKHSAEDSPLSLHRHSKNGIIDKS